MQPDSNGIRESEDFPMKHEQRDTREDRRTITKKMHKVINTNKINKKEKKNLYVTSPNILGILGGLSALGWDMVGYPKTSSVQTNLTSLSHQTVGKEPVARLWASNTPKGEETQKNENII